MEEQTKKLKDVRKGEFFKRLIKGQPAQEVYVKGEYDRAEGAYWCYKYYDVNDGRYIKASTIVNVGFTF